MFFLDPPGPGVVTTPLGLIDPFLRGFDYNGFQGLKWPVHFSIICVVNLNEKHQGSRLQSLESNQHRHLLGCLERPGVCWTFDMVLQKQCTHIT